MVRLAKVELVPSADVGGMLKGVGNLTKDALTFKWAQATMKDVAVNTVVVVEVRDISLAISIRKYSHKSVSDRLLVLYRGVHWQGLSCKYHILIICIML